MLEDELECTSRRQRSGGLWSDGALAWCVEVPGNGNSIQRDLPIGNSMGTEEDDIAARKKLLEEVGKDPRQELCNT